jgi:serine O-acetyltransferase
MASSANDIGLVALVREDLARHEGEWTNPGFQALAVYRFGRQARDRRGVAGMLQRRAHRVLYVFVRNVYGIEFPAEASIGRRLHVSHEHGIVINGKAVIGDDCAIANNISIGIGIAGKNSVPHLGDRVTVGPGAIVVGRIIIGDDVTIGPNAVVMTDVPEGAHVVANPGRVLRLGRADDTAPLDLRAGTPQQSSATTGSAAGS